MRRNRVLERQRNSLIERRNKPSHYRASALSRHFVDKLRKFADYFFSLKFYAGVLATWLLCAGKIDEWAWLATIGMVLASRQLQHFAQNNANNFRKE